jgi:hypothetical protein
VTPARVPGRKRGAGFHAAWLGLGLLMGACDGGGDGGGAVAVAEGDLIGKWILRKYHSEGYLKLGALTFPLDEDTTFADDKSYIDLKADHAFVSDMPDPETEGESTVEVGTWSLSGKTLTTIGSVDGEGEPDTVKWDVSLAGLDGVFSSHVDVKDGTFEQKQDVLINAVKK